VIGCFHALLGLIYGKRQFCCNGWSLWLDERL